MPNIRAILQRKGSSVTTVDRTASVLEAAKMMNEKHIGAVIVNDNDKIVGIFTERDILRRIVAAGLPPGETAVGDVMTSPMACCTRDATLAECRSIMSSKRIRHIPIVDDGQLYGIISAGDVMASECEEQQLTIEYLHEYLHGRT